MTGAPAAKATAEGSGRETIAIARLLPPDSPRSGAEDKAHIVRLAESDAELPPILVHRISLRVIDGMHRVKAAILNGQGEIAVKYFDGNPEEAFLCAVELNISHGLPLSLADRKAATVRILASRPELSDRSVAAITGLSSKTVAAIRRRANEESMLLHARLGADGRLRPLDYASGRRRAAEVIAERPGASLREIAASSGVSPGTARDVRGRLQRGENPVAVLRPRHSRPAAVPPQRADADRQPPPSSPLTHEEDSGRNDTLLPRLCKDPSLRLTENGRELLRWLHGHVIGQDDWSTFVSVVPAHCSNVIAELAWQSAHAWSKLATHLEQRDDGQGCLSTLDSLGSLAGNKFMFRPGYGCALLDVITGCSQKLNRCPG